MTENLVYKGVWFLPENPEHQVSGTLIFEPNSEPHLDLLGILVQKFSEHDPELILGYSTDGKLITLYKSYESSRSLSSPGLEVSEYTPMYILIGKHFNSESDLKFKIIKGRFSNLEQWINISGFQQVNTDYDTHETKIHYTLPDPIDFTLKSGTKVGLNFTSHAPYKKNTYTATVEQKSEIHIELPKEESFFDIMDNLMMFQNFLTLATFESAYPISITVVCFDSTDQENFTRVQVIYKPAFNYKANFTKNSSNFFLFKYKDIENNFVDIIQKWFELKEKIEPITNLLFESFYHNEVFNENKFLNIIHALESFHRRFRKNEVLSKIEHSKKIKNLVALVPDESKSWLGEILAYTNEPNLHKRLEELIEEASNDLLDKIILNKEQFIKDAKNSRNYYTHYNLNLKKKALKGSELLALTQRLRIILIILVMKEIGISKEITDKVISKRVVFFRNLF